MSGLRVIAGQARGRRLKMVPGDSTRPVSDRVKESLFNIIGPAVIDGAFLDLFAGTGSVGIEALSRGCAEAWFVENHPRALETIGANLAIVGLGENAKIVRSDAFAFLAGTEPQGFDFVYVAPPQYQGLWKACLEGLDAQPDWVNPDGWVITQIDPREYEGLELAHLMETDRRTYGNTQLVFYERPGW
jgi:16S rRNA (guanine966-N2)-methyltransferase